MVLQGFALACVFGVAFPAQAAEQPRTIPLAMPDEALMEDEFSAIDLFEQVKKLRPRVRLTGQGIFDQHFSGVDIDTYTTGLRTTVLAPLGERLAMRLVLKGDQTLTDFRGDSSFLDTGRSSGAPFDALYRTELRAEGRYQQSDSWVVFGGAGIRSRWEKGASFKSGFQTRGFAGLGYLYDDTFSVLAGVAISSRLGRGGTSFSPIVRLGWKISEDVEIQTEGMGLKIAARVHPTLSLYLRSGLEADRYRLGDRGVANQPPPPGEPPQKIGKGTLRDRRVPVLFGWSWKATKKWRVRGAVGVIAYRSYLVKDDDGDEVDKATSSNVSATGHLGVEYRF